MSQTQAAVTPTAIAFHPDLPLPFVKIDLSERGTPLSPGARIQVQQGELEVELELPGILEQLTGEAEAPDFSEGPGEDLALLFATLEGSLADYSQCTGRRERDREIQRIYRRLRDRPDGSDRNPLFGHLRGVFRLYLSVHPLSPAEYQSVLDCLIASVRHWAVGKDSCNYLDQVNQTLDRLLEAQAAAQEKGAGTEDVPEDPVEEA
jgi:hypothetical protein